MKTLKRIVAPACALTLGLGLAACGSSDTSESSDSGWTPITVKHALGTTEIKSEPKRVATVDWANQETPLALGIVPVGMAKMTWGDDNGNGVQPWVEDKLKELGAETPTLFDETDGYDFEAVANTKPDLILAGYSGMSAEDYEKLSKIAPTVAYPDGPWVTPWREVIKTNSKALGKEKEGGELVASLEKTIKAAADKHPAIKGKSAAYFTHIDPNDLSKLNFYGADDTREQYFKDLGMTVPASLTKISKKGAYSASISTENASELADVDALVMYDGAQLIKGAKADPVLSKLPAVANNSMLNLEGNKAIGTAGNPTPLSVPVLVEPFTELLEAAVTGKLNATNNGVK